MCVLGMCTCALWTSRFLSITLYCLVACVTRLFHFSLEEVYPYCKPIVVFGIIVGSFSRKWLELEDNGSTHTALSKQLTSVCQ